MPNPRAGKLLECASYQDTIAENYEDRMRVREKRVTLPRRGNSPEQHEQQCDRGEPVKRPESLVKNRRLADTEEDVLYAEHDHGRDVGDDHRCKVSLAPYRMCRCAFSGNQLHGTDNHCHNIRQRVNPPDKADVVDSHGVHRTAGPIGR